MMNVDLIKFVFCESSDVSHLKNAEQDDITIHIEMWLCIVTVSTKETQQRSAFGIACQLSQKFESVWPDGLI
jgi:hypothetical protein